MSNICPVAQNLEDGVACRPALQSAAGSFSFVFKYTFQKSVFILKGDAKVCLICPVSSVVYLDGDAKKHSYLWLICLSGRCWKTIYILGVISHLELQSLMKSRETSNLVFWHCILHKTLCFLILWTTYSGSVIPSFYFCCLFDLSLIKKKILTLTKGHSPPEWSLTQDWGCITQNP